MNTELIRMFNKEIGSASAAENFVNVNKLAMKCGYIIAPEACTIDVVKFLKEQKFNPNSTFFKTWEEIEKKSEWELLAHQLVHYMTTYGTNFILGNGYVPNSEVDIVPYNTYKIISSCTREEVFEDCYGMLTSGIAMSSNTINTIIEFICWSGMLKNVDIDEVKNKEAQCILSIKKGILPNDEFGMLRVLVYATTGSSMIIKSKNTLRLIKGSNSKIEFLLNNLDDKRLEKLSRIFLRYKPIFLAFKNNNTAKVINKIRRLAVKNHTPLKVGFWETILNPSNTDEVFACLDEQLTKITNFKKIQVMQGIKQRINSINDKGRVYIIRNGKMFVRKGYKSSTNVPYLMELYKRIETSVVDALKEKATTFKSFKCVDLAAPTSEKNFLGNFPMGTSIELGDKDNVLGIYWKNGWGVRDYDLHYCDENGNRYGWCYSHKGSDILFSGDMTNADPEATELYYAKKTLANGSISVNIYSRSNFNKPKLRFFVATDETAKNFIVEKSSINQKTYMIDPNKIKFDAYLEFDDESQKNIGYINEGKIYLMDLGSGYGRITHNTDYDKIIQQQNKTLCNSFVGMKRLLELAGFTEVEGEVEAELDLTNPDKNTLIKLFS